MNDKATGAVILVVATLVSCYYTVWAILLPFLEVSNPLHNLFPSREWAVRIPAFILALGLCSIGTFLSAKILFHGN